MIELRALIAAILVDTLASDTAYQLLAIRYGGGTQAQLTIDCGPLADAVIEALGLKKASRPSDYGYVQYPPGDRYITDWLADWEIVDD